jgi:hypothetical protein
VFIYFIDLIDSIRNRPAPGGALLTDSPALGEDNDAREAAVNVVDVRADDDGAGATAAREYPIELLCTDIDICHDLYLCNQSNSQASIVELRWNSTQLSPANVVYLNEAKDKKSRKYD